MTRAFTLIELIVVLGVLIALAGLVIPLVGDNAEHAAEQVTTANLLAARQTLVGPDGWKADLGHLYVARSGLPDTLSELVRSTPPSPGGTPAPSFDPALGLGWRGPYLQSTGARWDTVFVSDSERDAAGFDPATLGYTPVASDPITLDGWLRPIVLQIPTDGGGSPLLRNARLLSAGPDGQLETPPTATAAVDDDVVLYVLLNEYAP